MIHPNLLTGVSWTSRKAYSEVQGDGTAVTQREMVFAEILVRGVATRNGLSRALNLPINAICGRVNELIKDGKITESGTEYDNVTKKLNKRLIAQ